MYIFQRVVCTYMPKSDATTQMDKKEKFWRLGFTDSEIASMCGLKRSQVTSWRHNLGLKCHPEKPLAKQYGAGFGWMYRHGYNDKAIAYRYNFSARIVADWRRMKGLPPHKSNGSGRNEAI